MGLPKSKNAVGLGNSLMNDRFGKGKGADMRRGPTGIQRTGPDGQTYVTTPKEQAAWVKMKSVTEQNDLDDFLSTAELAGTDFTAEKMNNIKIIHRDQKNQYLLSATEERAAAKKQNANKKRLKVPRRPQWDEHTTPQELDARERESLLDWRRGLAGMQENDDLLMTPFERNLEVWRQLWRVIERSDLVVQIVDARNPLLFRCEDLENYVKEVNKRKNNLLLINKADMMSAKQRQIWADYFDASGINFRFFSAQLAKDLNESRESYDSDGDGEASDDVEEEQISSGKDVKRLARSTGKVSIRDEEDDKVDEEDDSQDGEEEDEVADDDDEDGDDEEWSDESDEDEEDEERADRTRIITTDELEALFLKHAPDVKESGEDGHPRKTQIGLVGYPNVGKSSTINALIGAKKVSVSSTPGKTKHFQTIHLSDQVILCDCPGLVFPNFASTKAELVCNGVLPIDQLREYTGPAALVAQRIPKSFMEAIYGMKINVRALEEGGTGTPTGEEVLRAYARARGFSTTGLGQPDESRAARYVLKDYVKGKLLFCHPPPSNPPIDGRDFNRELYDADHLPERRRAAFAADEDSVITGSDHRSVLDGSDVIPSPKPQGQKTQSMDQRFFARGQGNAGHLYKSSEPQGMPSGKQVTGRKLKSLIALEKDIDPADLRLSSKKHFKGNKKSAKKVRNEYT